MNKRILLGALLAGGLAAATAQADVNLPGGANVRFNGVTAFDTSAEPTINVNTGELVNVSGGAPITLTAFGSITDIVNADNTLDQGSITNGQELTFTYTGATLTPQGASLVGGSATSVTYAISTAISGGTITLYEDNTADLNTAGFFGDPAVVPAEATDGTPYLIASSPADMVGQIRITFNRVDANSPFTNYTIEVQSLNGNAFDITGGSLLDENPGLLGKKIQANQLGFFSSAFGTTDVDPDGDGPSGTVTINAPVDALIEGAVQMTITIPEPASLGLLGVAGLLLLSGRRTWRQEA
jgi:hypothetical protein